MEEEEMGRQNNSNTNANKEESRNGNRSQKYYGKKFKGGTL